MDNFRTYAIAAIQHCEGVKAIRIQLNGFRNLKGEVKKTLAQLVKEMR